MPIKVVAWFTSCTLSYCRSSVSRACHHTHSRHGRMHSVGVILYMHSPCDMAIHRLKSSATCVQKRRMTMGNGRPHAVDIIQFYRILTTDITLVITRSLEFAHHLGMHKTLNTRRQPIVRILRLHTMFQSTCKPGRDASFSWWNCK
jgi:hypothetical protein